MRIKIVLLTALLTLVGSCLAATAHADEDEDAKWNVNINPTTTVDTEVRLWLGGTQGNGGGGDDSFNRIGGETQEQYTARMRAFHDQQAAYCTAMFTDVQTRRLLLDSGSIALRNQYLRQCMAPGAADWSLPPDPPPNPAVLGAEAVAALTLPDATPMVGPDPSRNKWNMVAIGYPIWLWTEGVDGLTASASVRGHTVTLVARRTALTFNMGDGQKVSCTTATAWVPGVKAGAPSPTCGYTYQKTGQYRVAALAQWQVTWSVLGQSGTIPITKGAARQLPVGELQAVVVR